MGGCIVWIEGTAQTNPNHTSWCKCFEEANSRQAWPSFFLPFPSWTTGLSTRTMAQLPRESFRMRQLEAANPYISHLSPFNFPLSAFTCRPLHLSRGSTWPATPPDATSCMVAAVWTTWGIHWVGVDTSCESLRIFSDAWYGVIIRGFEWLFHPIRWPLLS